MAGQQSENDFFFLHLTEILEVKQNPGHEYFMKAAIEEARKAADRQEVPVGAVIVNNDVIIARAHNLTETLNDATAHAEMQAITAAASYLGGKYLNGCSIYVTIEPCAMCAGALGWSQISEIIYGAPDEKKGYSKISGGLLHPRTRVTKGVLEKECSELIIRFFESKR